MLDERAEALKAALPRTWPVFFGRHGHFTPVQLAAIRPILDGHDTLIGAPTAGGKTEAVIAPLLERLPQDAAPGLRILYICPTRALARDLYERLHRPLAEMRVTLGLKTGDTGPVDKRRPPTVLLTTPESVDSLLTRAPRLFLPLSAIVLDEIHLFDNSPRGDQLRCLLRRLERIRTYEQPARAPAQRLALSATVFDPEGICRRYLENGVVVQVGGIRPIEATLGPLTDLRELVIELERRPARKRLIFCNTRREVEQVAAYVRHHLAHEAQVFVHYSNLDSQMRQTVETEFTAAGVALCVSSSTLELGIDIGSIDEVVLVGPPPSLTAFLQRIGRGGRRSGVCKVLCLARSPLEWRQFGALLALTGEQGAHDSAETYHFRPSVLIQQIFSWLKQSPTGALRQADLRRLAPPDVPDTILRAILRQLVMTDYLTAAARGEWRPGEQLKPLIDQHQVFSNIGDDVQGITMIDAFSGRRIAQTRTLYRPGDTLLLGGRAVQVVWQDDNTFAVAPGRQDQVGEMIHFSRSPAAIPLDVAQALAANLGLQTGELAYVLADSEFTELPGMWLFHFWGSVYGEVLRALLARRLSPRDNQSPVQVWHDHCLYLPAPISQLPPWDERAASRAVRDSVARLEELLNMGRFHSLLPVDVARQAVVEQCQLARLRPIYQQARLVAPDHLRQELRRLV